MSWDCEETTESKWCKTQRILEKQGLLMSVMSAKDGIACINDGYTIYADEDGVPYDMNAGLK